eukprot:scaffold16189_cov21-Phaeocystis_antarctica.AAC.1
MPWVVSGLSAPVGPPRRPSAGSREKIRAYDRGKLLEVSETTFRRYRSLPRLVLARPNNRCTDPLACSYGRKDLKPRTFLQERRRSA